MYVLIVIIFILGYAAIAFEDPLKLNKPASALITGVLYWTIYMLQSEFADIVNEELLHHLGEVATIFLITIVMIAVVKQGISLLRGVGGLILFIIVLMSAIRIYKMIRK
jgi:hypothetical protein